MEPASIYSRIPWIPIVLRFSNHHFRILVRRSVSTMDIVIVFVIASHAFENSNHSIFHQPSFFFLLLLLLLFLPPPSSPSSLLSLAFLSFRSLCSNDRTTDSIHTRFGTRHLLRKRNPRIRGRCSFVRSFERSRIGRVGKKETKDGGAVPRYNNRAPQPRLADDFIELVSVGPRAQDLPETA